MTLHILLIEDDERLANLTAEYLRKNDFEVSIEDRGDTAENRILGENPDLVILDVMLPGKDGFEVCRSVREKYKGVILMLTARDEPVDRVIGLEMGADDYVGKPFDPRELVARIEAVLRRGVRPPASPDPEGGMLRFGAWTLDRGARQLSRAGESEAVALTSGEFALLNALVANANRPMKRERLLELTRGDESESFDRAIDVQIHRLRRLIEADPAHPRYLQTVWGVGYVFVPDSESNAAKETAK